MIRYRIDEALFGMAEAKRHLLAVGSAGPGRPLRMFGEAEKLLAMGKVTRAH